MWEGGGSEGVNGLAMDEGGGFMVGGWTHMGGVKSW